MPHINPVMFDLSHWDPAHDYHAAFAAGFRFVVLKASEALFNDDVYASQRRAARAAGLKVGSYHFLRPISGTAQAQHYAKVAEPAADELFACDWEADNHGNPIAPMSTALEFMNEIERILNRPGQCVMYGPRWMLERLYAKGTGFGARRTWVAAYGSVEPHLPRPSWLWQFTDGQAGPQPHTVPGVGHCDINSFDGPAAELDATWATGAAP